jgi:hypothetical protein
MPGRTEAEERGKKKEAETAFRRPFFYRSFVREMRAENEKKANQRATIAIGPRHASRDPNTAVVSLLGRPTVPQTKKKGFAFRAFERTEPVRKETKGPLKNEKGNTKGGKKVREDGHKGSLIATVADPLTARPVAGRYRIVTRTGWRRRGWWRGASPHTRRDRHRR